MDVYLVRLQAKFSVHCQMPARTITSVDNDLRLGEGREKEREEEGGRERGRGREGERGGEGEGEREEREEGRGGGEGGREREGGLVMNMLCQ